MKDLNIKKFIFRTHVIQSRILFGLLVLSGWQSTCVGAGKADRPASISSASRKFTVLGPDPAQNLHFATWLDRNLNRLEKVVGGTIPFTRGTGLRLVLDPAVQSSGAGEVKVEKSFRVRNRPFNQELVVSYRGLLDQEDVQEGLTDLLLHRLLSTQKRARPSAVPAWLSVGVAQNLFPDTRIRNRQALLKQWRQGQRISLIDLVMLDALREGRWLEKAAAGEFVNFLKDRLGSSLWRDLISLMNREEGLRSQQLFQLMGIRDERELEKEWDLWVAKLARIKTKASVLDPAALSEFKEFIILHAPRPKEGQNWATQMKPDSLIEKAFEPWMPGAALKKSLQLQKSITSAPEAMRPVLKAYIEFYKKLAYRRVTDDKSRRKNEIRKLKAHLNMAEGLFQELEQKQEQREQYLEVLLNQNAIPDHPIERRMPPSPKKKYLDQLERSIRK